MEDMRTSPWRSCMSEVLHNIVQTIAIEDQPQIRQLALTALRSLCSVVPAETIAHAVSSKLQTLLIMVSSKSFQPIDADVLVHVWQSASAPPVAYSGSSSGMEASTKRAKVDGSVKVYCIGGSNMYMSPK
jgi:hypothetical protein